MFKGFVVVMKGVLRAFSQSCYDILNKSVVVEVTALPYSVNIMFILPFLHKLHHKGCRIDPQPLLILRLASVDEVSLLCWFSPIIILRTYM